MAQRNTTSTVNELIDNKPRKQRPETLHFQASNPHRHRLRSEPVEANARLSPAERYINMRSQTSDLNNPPSETRSTASSTTATNHTQFMHEWHEQQRNDRYKNEPHRYKYGTPPPSSNQRIAGQTDKDPGHKFTLLSCIKPKR